jgi:hypothetical protein
MLKMIMDIGDSGDKFIQGTCVGMDLFLRIFGKMVRNRWPRSGRKIDGRGGYSESGIEA